MSYAETILEEVRGDAAPPDEHLDEARRRRDAVLAAAEEFATVRDTYVSGSIAHGTANTVKDADCGIVLDRRSHQDLGPDGDGGGPTEIVEDVRQHLRDSGLHETWEDIGFKVTNRATKVFFREPLSEECDPTVDLIVALDRKDAPGLWIPKGMEGSSPTWDASHPAKHTDLFLPADMDLRRNRVRTTRIAKLVNDSYTNWSFSSFNLAALAYFGIEQPQSLDKALLEFYVFAAKDLRDQLTPDPAGVSDSIKLPKGVTKDKAVKRFEKQRDLMEEAVEADSDEEAREALAKLLPDWVEPPEGGAASLAASIAAGIAPRATDRGVSPGATSQGREIKKNVRSYGEER